MTQDEIIQMAKQAGGKEIYSCVDPTKKTKGVMLDLAPLEAFAKLVKEKAYTAPPQRTWQGLTDEEIDVIDEATWDEDHKSWGIHDFARATEAKLKEKNTRQDGECKYCTHGCPACDARRQSNVLP